MPRSNNALRNYTMPNHTSPCMITQCYDHTTPCVITKCPITHRHARSHNATIIQRCARPHDAELLQTSLASARVHCIMFGHRCSSDKGARVSLRPACVIIDHMEHATPPCCQKLFRTDTARGLLVRSAREMPAV
eukprot:1159399-Pelagomonas_calceolata.AAC.5